MEVGMTEQAVLERVLELTSQHLGYRPDEVGAADAFVALGADSLQLIGILRQLEGEFGVRVSAQELLEEAPTPELTARLIASRAGRDESEPEATVHSPAPPASPAHPARSARSAPPESEYASRAEIAELTRQVNLLAETQAAMLTQLSEAVALLTAERAR
jgi:acyl carrier protein